jgi:hypothetical protein
LLASASLIAIALVGPHSASAEDCGCRDSVRAALTKQVPAAPVRKARPAPAPRRAARAPMRCTPCAAAAGGGGYDYASARAVDNYPYTHHWQVAPQGYVPPVPYGAPMVPAYDGPADLPPYGPYPPAYGPMSDLPPSAATAYAAGDDGYGAYGYAAYAGTGAPAITVDQGGWFGGVGRAYAGVGGGEGGGGGGLTLTLSQPDSLNGPSYNSFGQSYGGDYQSANKVNQFRQQAFTPSSSSGSGSGSGSK